jgi:hypothetical protein
MDYGIKAEFKIPLSFKFKLLSCREIGGEVLTNVPKCS